MYFLRLPRKLFCNFAWNAPALIISVDFSVTFFYYKCWLVAVCPRAEYKKKASGEVFFFKWLKWIDRAWTSPAGKTDELFWAVSSGRRRDACGRTADDGGETFSAFSPPPPPPPPPPRSLTDYDWWSKEGNKSGTSLTAPSILPLVSVR